jgi:hypothetical protein
MVKPLRLAWSRVRDAWHLVSGRRAAVGRELEIPIVVVLVLVTVGLGYLGFRENSVARGHPPGMLGLLYLTIQLFVLESGAVSPPVPWTLELARFAAPAIAVYAALKALAYLFSEQLQRWRVMFSSDHVVICGLGRKGLVAALAYRESGGDRPSVVVIEKDGDNDYLQRCRDAGALVLIGDATDPAILRRCQIQHARVVAALSGDDSANAEVALQVFAIVKERKGRPLQCVTHLVDVQLRNLIRGGELDSPQAGPVHLTLFNVYESGARAVIDSDPRFRHPDARPPYGHVLVVGIGQMGESLIAHLGRWWRRHAPPASGRVHISLVDRLATAKQDRLRARYPWLEEVAELRPIDADVTSAGFETGAFLDQPGAPDIAYVCLDDDALSLRVGLLLSLRTRKNETQIVVRMSRHAGLARLIGPTRPGAENLKPFGLLETACTHEAMLGGLTEIVAKLIHRNYVRDEEAKGMTPAQNESMVPWDELPEDLKDTNRDQARFVGDQLRSIGCHLVPLGHADTLNFEFHPDEIERLAEQEHKRWMEGKKRMGWTQGPTRDNERKIHPDMLPWGDAGLSESTKNKDRSTVRALPGYLEEVGYAIERRR